MASQERFSYRRFERLFGVHVRREILIQCLKNWLSKALLNTQTPNAWLTIAETTILALEDAEIMLKAGVPSLDATNEHFLSRGPSEEELEQRNRIFDRLWRVREKNHQIYVGSWTLTTGVIASVAGLETLIAKRHWNHKFDLKRLIDDAIGRAKKGEAETIKNTFSRSAGIVLSERCERNRCSFPFGLQTFSEDFIKAALEVLRDRKSDQQAKGMVENILQTVIRLEEQTWTRAQDGVPPERLDSMMEPFLDEPESTRMFPKLVLYLVSLPDQKGFVPAIDPFHSDLIFESRNRVRLLLLLEEAQIGHLSLGPSERDLSGSLSNAPLRFAWESPGYAPSGISTSE